MSRGNQSKNEAILAETLADFAARQKREKGRFWARQPKGIDKVMAQAMLRGGYGAQMSDARLALAWSEAAGPQLAKDTRAGSLRRGCLNVTASNSIVKQELTYVKEEIIQKLRSALPELDVRDWRVQIGNIN